MKKFNLFLIKSIIAFITFCICHALSNSFEMGGVAGIIIMAIYDLINEIVKED